jgi:predicted nucleic acid-binding protein
MLEELLKELSGKIVISMQVLKELAHVLQVKLKVEKEEVLRFIEVLSESCVVFDESPSTVKLAVELKDSFRLQFWDACIIASALENEIPLILTEDVTYPVIKWKDKEVEIVNPFA